MGEAELESYLDDVGPYEFEEFVGTVWESLGYTTEVTSGSRDRGIDIVAERGKPMPERLLIQAKAYGEDNSIGSEEVRKYATLYQQDTDADRVVVVTTSDFTSPAKALADDLDVDAIDRRDLLGLVAQSEIGTATVSPSTEESASRGRREDRRKRSDEGVPQTGSEGESDDESHPVWLPLLSTGVFATALIVVSGLYNGGSLSEGATGAIVALLIGVFVTGTVVTGRLYRTGRIDL